VLASRSCLEAGDATGALGLLQSEAEREPEPEAKAKLLVEAAELSFAQGNVPQARALIDDARRIDLGSAEAVLLSAKLALADGQRAQALGWLGGYAESKQRRRGPGLASVLRLTADLHLQQDELSEALPLLLEAHQLDKTDLETALLLGLLAIDLDRLETANLALRAVIAEREAGQRDAGRSPSVAQSYFQLARIEQHHGKKINAKRMAFRALEENPNLAPAQRLLSELGPH
jgi:tetratricopeptide (TPR) repeat protein